MVLEHTLHWNSQHLNQFKTIIVGGRLSQTEHHNVTPICRIHYYIANRYVIELRFYVPPRHNISHFVIQLRFYKSF